MLFLVEICAVVAYGGGIHHGRRSMSRQRSPSYPSVPLQQAVDLVAKIHKTCRTNIITREDAVREMGYSGLTGRSLKVLSALIQFGLLDKAGKGDVKVTQRAVEILHGIDRADREEAMLEAALAPQLFRDIHERFPDGIPAESAIRSYLIKQDFMDVAISPAINAFLETYRSVEHIRDSESHGREDDDAPSSVQPIEPKESPVSSAQASAVSAPAPLGIEMPSILAALSRADLNDIGMSMLGGKVIVAGVLDLKGLRALKRKIVGMEALLTDDEEGEDAEEAPLQRGFAALNPGDGSDDGSPA